MDHIHVGILASMGVDACREYRLSKVENVLTRLTAGATKCSICGINCYNTQKLTNHIKGKHLKKSSHKFTVCSKYFGDSQSLKVHRKKHAEGGYTLKCEQHHKKYPSRGKLNEHKETHLEGRFKCTHCAKPFKHTRNLRKHEKICKKRLSSAPMPKRFQCTLCHGNCSE